MSEEESTASVKNAGAESFEKNLDRLEKIVKKLEGGKVSLDEGMRLFKEGMQCSTVCKNLLETAQHELEKWQNGEAVPLTFDDSQKSLSDSPSK